MLTVCVKQFVLLLAHLQCCIEVQVHCFLVVVICREILVLYVRSYLNYRYNSKNVSGG